MADESNPLVNILLTSDAKAEMAAAKLEAASLGELEAWPCDSEGDERDLEDFLSIIQTRLVSLEATRETITKPMNQAKQAVDALFRAARKPYEEAKAAIKSRIEASILRRDTLRREALALAAEASKAGDTPTAVVALAVASDNVPRKGTHGSTWEWTWELEDIAEVPQAYLAVNPISVKLYLHRFKDSETIEPIRGLRFVRKPKVIARQG